MLSRTADNLYWLSRYVERAEYLARILDATQRLSALPLAYVGTSNEWESAVLTAGCASAFYKVYDEANEESVTDFRSEERRVGRVCLRRCCRRRLISCSQW